MRNVKPAYLCWKAKQVQSQEEAIFEEQLIEAGLPGDVAYNLGSAIELARDLGIELYKGMTFGDCRAVLPRANWRNDDGDPGEMFPYGQFLYKARKDVTEIQMLSANICFAITKCALEARQAGVI
jgi:hypothetical protein